ncbi:MAG: hypothetical protein E7565_07885 [Ruminococcaceae bacterium]|nr:hypothetical protein [Oscillospiraceae bacterium]
MKRILAGILVLTLVFSLAGCALLGGNKKLTEFHDKVAESQELLDDIADDVYSNWHGAIYDDEFNENINLAIASAMADHEADLDRIEVLDGEIAELFKSVKDDKECGSIIKEVMSAYSDYYEFVVNVSGSFNSFSASKETLKKELASTLKDLSYEL